MKIKLIKKLLKLGKNHQDNKNKYSDGSLLLKLAMTDNEVEKYNKIIDENIKSNKSDIDLLNNTAVEYMNICKVINNLANKGDNELDKIFMNIISILRNYYDNYSKNIIITNDLSGDKIKIAFKDI